MTDATDSCTNDKKLGDKRKAQTPKNEQSKYNQASKLCVAPIVGEEKSDKRSRAVVLNLTLRRRRGDVQKAQVGLLRHAGAGVWSRRRLVGNCLVTAYESLVAVSNRS